MSNSIYVAAPEGLTGKSMVAVGMIEALIRTVGSVGVFRPVVRSDAEDEIARILIGQPGIAQTYAEAVGVTYEDVRSDPDAALHTLVEKYAAIKERFDSVVVLGSDYTDVNAPTELTFNARVAANLNAPVILVVSAKNRTPEIVRSVAEGALAEFRAHHAKVIAVIANRVASSDRPASEEVDPVDLDAVRTELAKLGSDLVVAALPADRLLAAPTLRAQFEAVEANLVLGNPDLLNAGVGRHPGGGDDPAERSAPTHPGIDGHHARRSLRHAARDCCSPIPRGRSPSWPASSCSAATRSPTPS